MFSNLKGISGIRFIRTDRKQPGDIGNLTAELQTNLWLCCNKLCATHVSKPEEIMLLNYCYGYVGFNTLFVTACSSIKSSQHSRQSEFLNRTTNLTYSAFYHTLLISTGIRSELPYANTILNNTCDEIADSGYTYIQHVMWKFVSQNAQDSVLGVDLGKVFTASQV
jgi:hypothetical protein